MEWVRRPTVHLLTDWKVGPTERSASQGEIHPTGAGCVVPLAADLAEVLPGDLTEAVVRPRGAPGFSWSRRGSVYQAAGLVAQRVSPIGRLKP